MEVQADDLVAYPCGGDRIVRICSGDVEGIEDVKQKNKTLLSIAIALGIACAVFGGYRWSAYRWDQSFIGRPLSELEGALAERGKSLGFVAPDSFQMHTGEAVGSVTSFL